MSNTLLTPEELAGLKLSITTKQALNKEEHLNIAAAQAYFFSQRFLRKEHEMSEGFLLKLHQKMFGDVWKWAGYYRTQDKNIGVPFYKIREQMKLFLLDAEYWRQSFVVEEYAVRFHHRLVQIHPFANGNGRHARMVADFILFSKRHQCLGWGGGTIQEMGILRKKYIQALKKADNGNFEDLMAFAMDGI
ncbi:MAG: hypothetical protein A2Y14_03185 [Verrucomicrobia bacterium GWF2_51_19]|nr:MAG: hypothetical protein A2Y14_03185 [Verrucomicrobia bacterium GWF2_51_19]HCJ12370.1 mobile mystery protein B [Opitutae bacterium]